MEKQEILNYEEFVAKLRVLLYRIIPPDVTMEIHSVLKNNSVCLDGLTLFRPDCKASPNFYLQDYYERYTKGAELTVLSREIYELWKKTNVCSLLKIPLHDFEQCRDRIVYRLVNAEKNQEFLAEVPYVPFLDMAIVFYYLVMQDSDGIGSVRITNDLMERWGLDTKTLMELAGKNTPRLFPALTKSLFEWVDYLMKQNNITQEIGEEDVPCTLVLTNQAGINGASVWLYPGMASTICKRVGNRFYLIPSSIHEMLVLPDDGQMTSHEVVEMLRSVNRMAVGPDEFLSDNVYLYDGNVDGIRIITM